MRQRFKKDSSFSIVRNDAQRPTSEVGDIAAQAIWLECHCSGITAHLEPTKFDTLFGDNPYESLIDSLGNE
jgi:hypothetical protein